MTQDPVMAAHTDRSDLFELVRYCRFTLYCVMCTRMSTNQGRLTHCSNDAAEQNIHQLSDLPGHTIVFLLTYEGC